MPLFEDRAIRYITDLIRDFKLEDFQAAGFPGNFGVETGGFEHVQEIDPIGGGRGGLGDAQWTGPRRRDFEAWLARHPGWGPADYGANYSMLFRDLEGPESAALDAVRQARDVDEATEIVMRRYERPGVEHLDRRKEYGRRALAAFRAAGINVAALKAQGRPGETSTLPNPPIASQPAGNPLAAIFPALQAHRDDARKIAIGVVGAFNLLYPDDMIVIQNVKPEPPKAPPVTQRPSVQLGLGGLFASLIGMATGAVGTPFGMGAEPTTAGTLAALIPAAISAIGATGGGWLGLIGPILSAVGGLANKAKP